MRNATILGKQLKLSNTRGREPKKEKIIIRFVVLVSFANASAISSVLLSLCAKFCVLGTTYGLFHT